MSKRHLFPPCEVPKMPKRSLFFVPNALKKTPFAICNRLKFSLLCRGESEIRTRDTLLGYTRFPGVLSSPWRSFKCADNQLLKLLSFFSNIVLASYLRVYFLPKMISITLGLSVAKLCNHFRFSIKMHTNDNCQPSKR